jgi:hypothetical protein
MLCAAASVALYSASCSSSGGGGEGGEAENPAFADVIYAGDTTDEALEQLIAATAKDDAAKAPVFDSPADGAELPAATPAKFSWHAGTAALPGAPSLRFAGRRAPSFSSPLAELFGPERAAHAHGDPLNGTAYWLVFSTPANAKLLRVFTAETSYTPDAAAWDKLVKASDTITVTIKSAIFDTNELAADGGPWAGTPVKVTVK